MWRDFVHPPVQKVKGVRRKEGWEWEEEQKDKGHMNAWHNMTQDLLTGRIQRINYGGHDSFGKIVLKNYLRVQ